ncbi:hypothetical protein [Actinomyces viscosus]|uniref:Uncharacterized protein n=1 Tax=Actinomyces viscosus TaxID=1656 RepID=A0A3S4V216_ACTVI|nr:hypothetical protein [Actinomyces viscosus]VEI15568.1 Uncharacterised protein [Actinomyces viscosus]
MGQERVLHRMTGDELRQISGERLKGLGLLALERPRLNASPTPIAALADHIVEIR